MQTLPPPSVAENLQTFAQWASQYCTGSERANAQPFLIEFFKAFGYPGALEAGARFEDPLKKGSSKGNTGFLDCIYKDVALIEMKKRGTPLGNFYNQLLNYWVQLTPKPKYAILCNFDEFWIYDFNVQVDTPVQALNIDTLHLHPEALAFMQGKKPNFGLNTINVTEQAAKDVSQIYNSLIARKDTAGFTEEDARRFILQCVLCMFAEDIGLMPACFFTNLMEECSKDPTQSYDILRALFTQMNTRQEARGGRFKGIRYFNGGLFSHITPIEMTADECERMYQAAREDWRGVRPSIFGTIFEATLTDPERHAGGVHFTSDLDIYKIVNPTIVRYWEERIEAAGDNVKRLRELLDELRIYRVLDPACGSGNFLYIAYLELKRLEKQLMDRIQEVVETPGKRFTAKDTEGTHISLVSPLQFYGIEIKPFGVELAKLTLEIGRKIAVDKFGLSEDPLPLDNLDANILCADALFTDWPQADAVIGNPPFLGSKHYRKCGFTEDYIDKLHSLYPSSEFHKASDFCTYWFRKAHDSQANRIGLVATNSISQGQSRSSSLDYIVSHGGYIFDAISTQVWSGEAKVHVSIINWSKDKPKTCFLDQKSVGFISNNLKATTSITGARKLTQNKNRCFQGVVPLGEGFIITRPIVESWIKLENKNIDVIKEFSMGANLADHPEFSSNRWIIDFNKKPLEEASTYQLPFNHLKETVKPIREKVLREARRKNWWQFGENATGMRNAISTYQFCFAVPRVSKWTVFIEFPKNTMLAGDKTIVVVADDYAVLGILNSKFHRDWIQEQMSTLKADPAYTNTTCFETFPFLWDAPEKLKDPVRAIMQTLDEYRMGIMKERKWGITQLYNAFFTEPASQLYKLHRQLDEAVCAVYGWKFDPTQNYNEKLFDLNQQLHHTETMPLLPMVGKAKKKRGKA